MALMRRLILMLCLCVFPFALQAQVVSFRGACQDALIDVRSQQEYQEGHAPGAINIPLEQLASGIQTVSGLKKNSRILVYCRSGRRSAQAVTLLKARGYTQVSDGGALGTLKNELAACNTR